jgi:hypothetical protein
MIRCMKGTVIRLLPLMSLVTIHWLFCLFCDKALSAEDKPEATRNAERTTICDVLSNPGTFNGKMIELRVAVSAGLETNVLYYVNCSSTEQWPASILLDISNDVSRTENKEYNRFWNLVHAYKHRKGKQRSIMPDKYTVTATVIGRFEAGTPFGTGFAGQLILSSVRDVLAHPFDASLWTLTTCDLVKDWKFLHEKKVRVRAIYTGQVVQGRNYYSDCPQIDAIAIQWPDHVSGALKTEIGKLKQYVANDKQARAWVVVEGVFYAPEPSKRAETASSLAMSAKEQIRKSQSGLDYIIKVTKLINTSAVADGFPRCPKCPPMALSMNDRSQKPHAQ